MASRVVFIHGAWLTSQSWENLIAYFERRGVGCDAPEWPLKDRPLDELRRDPPAELAEIGVQELVDHYETIVKAYPEPPILIGHSFGGLIVQQLLDRGLGSAGVGLNSAAPEGVLAVDWKVLKANSNVLFRWMAWDKVLTMTLPEFQYAFVNTFPEAEQRRLYDRYVVPESGRIFFQAAFASLDPRHALRVDFRNSQRAPLLLTAGEFDHLVPAHVARGNYEHYKDSSARTDFHEFAGRSHLLVAGEGWEEVADCVWDWLGQQGVVSPMAGAGAGSRASGT